MAWWDKLGQGIKVARPTLVLINDTVPLFTVAGGKVLLTNIIGTITTIIGGAANYYLQHDPTEATATTLNMCASTNINGWNEDEILAITGAPGDTFVPVARGGAAPGMTMPVILTPGDIEAVCDAAPGGSVLWEIWYKTLDDDAYVFAA